jgi:hypothetical protein
MLEFSLIHPFKGGFFHWSDRKLFYTSYRIGPFVFRYYPVAPKKHIQRRRKIGSF